MHVEIRVASQEEKYILRHLMELYLYDSSEFTDANIGHHGLFEYPYLDHYWTDPNRYPFLVRVENTLAGFALIHNEEPTIYSVTEFFILRKYRQRGLGRLVAHQIFDMFPGHWRVQPDEKNLIAQAFWRKVVASYTKNHFQER